MSASVSPSAVPAARGTSVISAEQLAVLRGMLEQQRRFRIDQLAELDSGAEVDDITGSLIAGARAALREVELALSRMDAGTYGTCRSCGAPVPLERLEILPQIARCMPCQQAAEPS